MYQIDTVAALSQMVDHIVPVWKLLPKGMKGTFYVYDSVFRYAQQHYPDVGFTVYRKRSPKRIRDNKSVVLAANDSILRLFAGHGNKTILMSHSCGDTIGYPDTVMPQYLKPKNPLDCKNTLLCLSPGHHIAGKFKKIWPNIPVEIVGCPKLDPAHVWGMQEKKTRNDPPIVVISFTWNWQDTQWRGNWAKSIRGAWAHYVEILPELAKNKSWQLYGSAHPKMYPVASQEYRRLGIPMMGELDDFGEVMKNADLYIDDFSSTLFEFASMDKPVILMNAPWHDKKAEHGLRFWKAADVGIQVNGPGELIPAIERALEDPPEIQRNRQKAMDYVFPVRDGTAAKKAAAAILQAIKESDFSPVVWPGGRTVGLVALKSFTIGATQISPGTKFRVRNEQGQELCRSGLAILPEQGKVG